VVTYDAATIHVPSQWSHASSCQFYAAARLENRISKVLSVAVIFAVGTAALAPVLAVTLT
jgi:hypothetical protein